MPMATDQLYLQYDFGSGINAVTGWKTHASALKSWKFKQACTEQCKGYQ